MTEKMVEINGTLYPKWAVVRAKNLLKRVDHNDLERMLQSVLIVTDKLKNAVLADSNESIEISIGSSSLVFMLEESDE